MAMAMAMAMEMVMAGERGALEWRLCQQRHPLAAWKLCYSMDALDACKWIPSLCQRFVIGA